MKSLYCFCVVLLLSGNFISCQQTVDNQRVETAEGSSASSVPVSQKPFSMASKIPAASTSRSAGEMVAAGFKRYGVEKGVVVFRLDGAIKGSEILYFDHWGWREAKIERNNVEIGDYHEATNQVQYLDGERRYVYDPKTNTAKFFDSPQIQAAAEQYGTKDMVVVGLEMLKKRGGIPEGKDTVANLECDVWQLPKYRTTLCMWNGLTLKEASFVNNVPVGRRAMSVKTDSEIPEEKLVLPAGVVVAGLGN